MDGIVSPLPQERHLIDTTDNLLLFSTKKGFLGSIITHLKQ
jgi:hypothetical protein